MHVTPLKQFVFALIAAAGTVVAWTGVLSANEATSRKDVAAAKDVPAVDRLFLDDEPEPLEAKQARTEEDRDRLEALSLYAAARMHLQKRDFDVALRLFQRAYRDDQTALPILQEIVPLAFSLGRNEEAVRYALKVVQLEPNDTRLMQRLATHLTSQQDFDGALELYESIAAQMQADEDKRDYILLVAQMGKLYFVAEKHLEAADAFAKVVGALDAPADHDIDDPTRRALLEDAARAYDLLRNPASTVKRSNEALAYSLFGEVFLEADRADDAKAAFDKAQELDANDALYAYNQARLLAAAKKPAEAVEQLDVYLDSGLVEFSTAPYRLLEELYEQLDRKDEVTVRLAALADGQPDNQLLAATLAERYRKEGQLDKAEPIYRKLLEESSDENGRAPLALIAYRSLVDVYRQLEKPELLFDAMSDALAKYGSFEILGGEGEDVFKNEDLAKSIVRIAHERYDAPADDVDADRLLAAATMALEAGDVEAASAFFNAALTAQKDARSEMLLDWALSLMMKEKYEEAVAVMRRGLDEGIVPKDDPEFLFYLAGVVEMAGHTDEALSTAEKAAELAETQAENLGDRLYRIVGRPPWILYHAKRYDEAVDRYEKLLDEYDTEYASSAARSTVRDARMVLSNICVLLKRQPEAEEWLEQVLDEYPDDISAKNDLGYLWIDQNKRLNRALKMVQDAVASDEDNAAYRDSLGWAYYRLGRYDEALVELEKTLTLTDEPDPVILDHLGDVYASLGRMDDARKVWQDALAGFEKIDDENSVKAVTKKLKSVPDDGNDPVNGERAESNKEPAATP